MAAKSIKSILVAVLSTVLLISSYTVRAQHEEQKAGEEHSANKKEGFNAKEVIFDHIMDAHEFHFVDYKGSDGQIHPVAIPLPVMLYSPQKGFSGFMSSAFEHGHAEVDGYKLAEGKIIPTAAGVTVYDLSLTRNVVQMILALALLVWLMISVAKTYASGQGVTSAPKGKQNLVEVMVAFVRDEIARPNLRHKANKYLPYLLTVFFFILINNIIGLVPGTANVTGNIAFTVVLGLISFVVIMFSSNSHYWGHIFNPPGVPGFVKPILVLVEFLSVFIKPFALIIRLFANMVAGHIIIICLISLIFIFAQIKPVLGIAASPVSVAFTVFIYFIEILVAFLQAFIFTVLTAVFIGQAFEGEHEPGDHHPHPDEAIIV
ncbi:MAG: F0F1 ATP synthase subunit A [Ferruginibacter sp.]|nr:F0F1 ATP synthase subunit A [Ferruginibacter sp.]